jgi:hypothetical protein
MNWDFLLRAVATCLALVEVLLRANCGGAEEPVSPSSLEQRLAAYYAPPKEFVGDAGDYRSPLSLADGGRVQSASQWQQRRTERIDVLHSSSSNL